MSLVEVLVVLGIMGVISMAMLTMSDTMNSQMNDVRDRTDYDSVVNGIKATLKDEDSCVYTLTNSGADPTDPTKLNLNHVSYYDTAGNPLAVVVPPAAWSTGILGNPAVKMTSIQMTKPGDATNPPIPVAGLANTYAADIIITVNRTRGHAFKSYVLQGFQVTMAGAAIQRCKLGMSQICNTGFEQYDGAGSYSTGITSADSTFTGVFTDVFTQNNSGGMWGLQCVAGWKMTGCSASALKPITSTSTLVTGTSSCQAADVAASAGVSRVYLTCCSE